MPRWLLLFAASILAAQSPKYGVGRAPTAEELRQWSISIAPDGQGTLRNPKPLRTVGSYWPYATTIWDYVNRAMPFDRPGTLTADQVYSLTAYVLYLNGLAKEDEVIDARTLPKIRMPNRDGFVADPRPD